jgi:hypothetical protein
MAVWFFTHTHRHTRARARRSIVIVGIVIVATGSTPSACATSATSFDEPTLAIALAAHSATTFGRSAFHCSF